MPILNTFYSFVARYCGQPPEIDNGYVEPRPGLEADGVYFGKNVQYQCKPGFAFQSGDGRLSCPESGVWGTRPVCTSKLLGF